MPLLIPTLAPIVLAVLRVALVLAFGLVAARLLRRAASKRIVLACALVGALVVPLVSSFAPAFHVVPAAVLDTLGPAPRGREVVEALVDAPASPAGASVAAGAAIDDESRGTASRFSWPLALGVVWALGAGLLLARLARGHARVRRIVRASRPASWSDSSAYHDERMVRTHRAVRYAAVDAPAVTGIVRPVILVPESAASWSDERRRSVLLHELAHVRQQDCLIQLLAEIACALHWYNPLVWLAARRLRLVRELAADAAVLSSGLRASSYAEHLVAIARSSPGKPAAPLGALGMASELETRIVAIVAAPPKRLGRAGATALLAVTSCACAVIACAKPAPTAPPPTVAAATSASPPAPIASLAPSAPAGDTLDPKVQAIADEELARVLRESKARGGTIVVLDANTGAIVADAKSNLEPTYVTGSTLKPLVLAGAIEDGIVRADERFDLEHGAWSYQGKTMHDAGKYGTLSVSEMLAVSSNIGFTKIFDRMGGERLAKWLHAFHVVDAPGGMPWRVEDKTFAGAMVAIGETATATPLQLAAAYVPIANGGIYVTPYRTGAAPSGARILGEVTTQTVRTMLEGVVYGAQATGKRAQVDGIRVAGKTGTAEWDLPGGGVGTYASFAGYAPATAPRFVIVVGVDRPGTEEKAGGIVAAPAFARVAARALARR